MPTKQLIEQLWEKHCHTKEDGTDVMYYENFMDALTSANTEHERVLREIKERVGKCWSPSEEEETKENTWHRMGYNNGLEKVVEIIKEYIE